MQSDYWTRHYDFGKPSKRLLKGMGLMSRLSLLINTFVPVLYAYSHYTDDHRYADKAIRILESQPAEKNDPVRKWETLGIKPVNAAESQGLIELYGQYCYKKQCLNCNIGTELLLKTDKKAR